MADSIYPWRPTQRWLVEDYGTIRELTVDDLITLHKAIADGSREPQHAIGCSMRSERRFDRAIGLLKRAGLVKYNHHWSRWVAVE